MIIAKIYNSPFDNKADIIIDEIYELSLDKKISAVSKWELTIPLTEWIKQFQKIELCNVANWQDNIFFSGTIYSLNPSLNEFELSIRDENWLMLKKAVLSNKSYVDKTPGFILDDILTERNQTYSENWQVESSVEQTISIDFKKGDNLQSVLNILYEQLQCNRTVRGWTIYFDNIVGIDKTQWDDFVELVYNWLNHREDNIANISRENYGSLSNIILWQNIDWDSLQSDTDSVNDRQPLFEAKRFADWDLNSLTNNYLDYKKDDLFNYIVETAPFGVRWYYDSVEEVERTIYWDNEEYWDNDDFWNNYELVPVISPNNGDYFMIWLWDKIHLRVENTNSYLNFEWDITISGITLEYKNATLIQTINVETQVVKDNYLWNRLEKIEENLNFLNIY